MGVSKATDDQIQALIGWCSLAAVDKRLSEPIILIVEELLQLRASASQHEAELARAADALRVAQEESLQLRKLLWLHHGHEGPALYGDDGEMQCHACVIDFRRADPNDIDERWYAEGVKRYHAEQSALAEVTRERDLYKHSAEVGCINSLDAEQINEGLRTALRRIAERRPKPSERADNGCHPGCECVYCTADTALSVEPPAPALTLEQYLERQEEWSSRTFGHGTRTLGLTKHIEKEIAEIRAKPHDLSEWVDVVILALDGYWRHGGDPLEIMKHLVAKQEKNFVRQWPTSTSEEEAIEHVRAPAPQTEPCPECRGSGEVRPRGPNDKWTEACPACKGIGKEPAVKESLTGEGRKA